MAEQLGNPGPERAPQKQAETSPEHHRPTHHKAEQKLTAQEKAEQLDQLRREVGKEAKVSGDIKLDQASEQTNAAPAAPINRELKSMMRTRTLTRIRKELPASQRALSKVVHAKPVEVVSAAGEKTIARPLGLATGGLFALVGSIITFYTAKHYGFRYNLLLFFLLFMGGYIIGTVLEFMLFLAKKLNK